MKNKISIGLVIIIISFFVVAISMDIDNSSKITGLVPVDGETGLTAEERQQIQLERERQIQSEQQQGPIRITTWPLDQGWDIISITRPMVGKSLVDMAERCGGRDGGGIAYAWTRNNANERWELIKGTDRTYGGRQVFRELDVGNGLWIYTKLRDCVLTCGVDDCET